MNKGLRKIFSQNVTGKKGLFFFFYKEHIKIKLKNYHALIGKQKKILTSQFIIKKIHLGHKYLKKESISQVLKNCKLKIQCLKNTYLHKILTANEAVAKQDLPCTAGDRIGYNNLESLAVWQCIPRFSKTFIFTDSIIMSLEIHLTKC